MLARLIDPDSSSGVLIWLIEVEGGPRMLAREDQFRPVDGADVPIVVEATSRVCSGKGPPAPVKLVSVYGEKMHNN